jgi:hypothetical protein
LKLEIQGEAAGASPGNSYDATPAKNATRGSIKALYR